MTTTRYRFVGDSPREYPFHRRVKDGKEEPLGKLKKGDEFDGPAGLRESLFERRQGDAWVPSAPVVPTLPELPENANELASLLADKPELAPEVEFAEKKRDKPRETVVKAIERARQKVAE